MINLRDIAGHLQDKIRKEGVTTTQAKFLKEYLPRLVNDLNRIAAAKVQEAGLSSPLTFSGRLGQDPNEIVVTPSNPDLFRKLEFGEFDANGTMTSPPHSVLTALKVTVQLR